MQDQRETYKKNHPELSHKEVIAKLGDVWNHLPEKEKEPFVAKANKDKEKYSQQKEEYLNKNKSAAPASGTPKKKNKDETEPGVEKKVKKVYLINLFF